MARRVRAFLLVPPIVILAMGTQPGALEIVLSLAFYGQNAVYQHLENHPGAKEQHSHTANTDADQEHGPHGYSVPLALHQPATPDIARLAPLHATGGFLSLLASLIARPYLEPHFPFLPAAGVSPPESRHPHFRLLTTALLAPNSPPRL